MNHRSLLTRTLVIAFALAGVARAAEAPWDIAAAWSYTKGDYGTGSTTRSIYMPFTLRRLFDQGDIGLTLPFVSNTSDGQVTLVDGRPLRSGRIRTRGGTERITESGFGDMILKGRWYAVEERQVLPSIVPVAHIKFPTASRDKGLGTGEFDEGVGIELTKTIAEKHLAMAEVGYTFIGNPPGQTYRDQWRYGLGYGYYFLSNVLGSAWYEQRRALREGDPGPRDLYLTADWRVRPAINLEAGLQFGLSDGSPDFGLSVGAHFGFDPQHLLNAVTPRTSPRTYPMSRP